MHGLRDKIGDFKLGNFLFDYYINILLETFITDFYLDFDFEENIFSNFRLNFITARGGYFGGGGGGLREEAV